VKKSDVLGGGSEIPFKHKGGVSKPHFSINTKSKMSNISKMVPYYLIKHCASNTSNWKILVFLQYVSYSRKAGLAYLVGGNFRL